MRVNQTNGEKQAKLTKTIRHWDSDYSGWRCDAWTQGSNTFGMLKTF